MALPRFSEPYMQALPRLQLGFDEAASTLGLPLSTLEQIHRRGEGPPFFKIGRRLFTTEALIKDWQDGLISKVTTAD